MEISDELLVKLKSLHEAINFLDKCRAAGDAAYATGAMRDAREWLDSSARAVDQVAEREGILKINL